MFIYYIKDLQKNMNKVIKWNMEQLTSTEKKLQYLKWNIQLMNLID